VRVARYALESGTSLRQREKLTDNVASAAQEIERLRLRQEELEREKARMAELNPPRRGRSRRRAAVARETTATDCEC